VKKIIMCNKDVENKSISRSKKSFLSMADILIESGVSLVPGGSIEYKLIKTLGTHALSWKRDFTIQRLEEFHEKIIKGVPPESRNEFLRNQFSMGDYYSLLKHVTEDEENEKIEIYARLFQGLILNVISPEIKLHLIKAVRELEFSDFDFMRQVYINEKYEFKGPGSKSNQIKSLTVPRDPIKCHSVQTLIRLGFLYEKDGTKPPWPTGLLKMIVEFLYEEKDIASEAEGKAAQMIETARLKIFFACDKLDIFSPLLADIGDRLYQHGIKNIIANPIHKTIPLIMSPIIAVCVYHKGNPIENLKKFVNLEQKTIVQIVLPGASKEDLPLACGDIFDFTHKDVETECNKLIEFIQKQLKLRGASEV